jgi:DNA repair exonuclease SbcCD ATPase subunit
MKMAGTQRDFSTLVQKILEKTLEKTLKKAEYYSNLEIDIKESFQQKLNSVERLRDERKSSLEAAEERLQRIKQELVAAQEQKNQIEQGVESADDQIKEIHEDLDEALGDLRHTMLTEWGAVDDLNFHSAPDLHQQSESNTTHSQVLQVNRESIEQRALENSLQQLRSQKRAINAHPPIVEDEAESLAKELGSTITAPAEEEPQHRGEIDQHPILQLLHESNPLKHTIVRSIILLPRSFSLTALSRTGRIRTLTGESHLLLDADLSVPSSPIPKNRQGSELTAQKRATRRQHHGPIMRRISEPVPTLVSGRVWTLMMYFRVVTLKSST